VPLAECDGAWLHWRGAGPADGEPVLMIMGLGGSGRMWWRLEPQLADRWWLLLIDNRGTGDSDRVSGPLTMAGLAADAVAVLDAAGVESAHVVGASMGGMIAQHLALDHRDRVRSLVLACTTAGGRAGAPPWRLLAASALRPMLGPGRTFGLVAPALYAARTRREQPERVREDLAVRIADATPAATVYAQMAAAARHDTRARLRELAGLPVTVLHGSEDALVPVARGRELAEAIPGARLIEFPETGHLLATDAEAEVGAALRDHLQLAWYGSARKAEI
jgi:3-oxoadipate enol-lactonase